MLSGERPCRSGSHHRFSLFRAALFPFGKEMHSLPVSRHVVLPDSQDIRCKVHGDDRSFCPSFDEGYTNPDIIIENIERVDWEDFDTIILGHMGQLAQLVKATGFSNGSCPRSSLTREKVVAFDDLRIVETGLPMDKVYCPVVRKEHMPGNRFGKLYRCPKPVLGISGQAPRQGKFTLQLYLRKELMYRVIA